MIYLLVTDPVSAEKNEELLPTFYESKICLSTHGDTKMFYIRVFSRYRYIFQAKPKEGFEVLSQEVLESAVDHLLSLGICSEIIQCETQPEVDDIIAKLQKYANTAST